MHDHNAFTMMELLLVIALVGLLAYVAGPSVSGILGDWEFQNARQKLEADLTSTRYQAYSLETPEIITLNASTYDLFDGRSVTLPYGVTFADLTSSEVAVTIPHTITFDKFGGISDSIGFSLQRGGTTVQFSVNTLGRVTQ
ncbi:MAG: prepilin-type N-terminal cleavage/methylation domain-containing protein [Candidatus Wallbacteria bacterium]|nr:prepilin-type N-terminal cleavage/methylation domain-containing protein [Candidatus Wallbacteria bacterium]